MANATSLLVTVVGAFAKGRSASRRLNMRCRRMLAVETAGGLVGFFPWGFGPSVGGLTVYRATAFRGHRGRRFEKDVEW